MFALPIAERSLIRSRHAATNARNAEYFNEGVVARRSVRQAAESFHASQYG